MFTGCVLDQEECLGLAPQDVLLQIPGCKARWGIPADLVALCQALPVASEPCWAEAQSPQGRARAQNCPVVAVGVFHGAHGWGGTFPAGLAWHGAGNQCKEHQSRRSLWRQSRDGEI